MKPLYTNYIGERTCYWPQIFNTILSEVGTCATIIAAEACGATIILAIALTPLLFLNGWADSRAASTLAQFKYV